MAASLGVSCQPVQLIVGSQLCIGILKEEQLLKTLQAGENVVCSVLQSVDINDSAVNYL
jgi:hypothetical protein